MIENKTQPVIISSKTVHLNGILHIPQSAKNLVLFVHGSGSSRFSTRNQYVAKMLNDANIATILFDLLTPEEEEIDEKTSEYRFNIEMLALRLIDVTAWCHEHLAKYHFPLGYFGASTGAAAALVAAADAHTSVNAIVSRGGRPDLAGKKLPKVKAPTLLIVGGNDGPVIEMNQEAMTQMHCKMKLEIIPGATHLFEEPGALERVGELAVKWFTNFLVTKTTASQKNDVNMIGK